MPDEIGRLKNELRQQAVDEMHERQAERATERAERNAERLGQDADAYSAIAQAVMPADVRPIVGVAMIEATNRSAPTVEAEHILLAFLFARTSQGAAILAQHGLTYESFDAALQQERERTLAGIGIRIPDPSRLQAAPRVRMGRPRFGASAKEAFERASKAAKARRGRAQRFSDIDFLIGILSAELGTVPRALLRGGFDRQQLLDALGASLTTSRKDSK